VCCRAVAEDPNPRSPRAVEDFLAQVLVVRIDHAAHSFDGRGDDASKKPRLHVGSAIRGSASPRPHRPTASDRCGISHGVDHAAEDPQDVGLTGVLKGVTDVSPPRARRAGCPPS
jgi:hypothetical protein